MCSVYVHVQRRVFKVKWGKKLTWMWRFHFMTSGALQYAITTPSSSATAELGQWRESALKTVDCWVMPISSRCPSQTSGNNYQNLKSQINLAQKSDVLCLGCMLVEDVFLFHMVYVDLTMWLLNIKKNTIKNPFNMNWAYLIHKFIFFSIFFLGLNTNEILSLI